MKPVLVVLYVLFVFIRVFRFFCYYTLLELLCCYNVFSLKVIYCKVESFFVIASPMKCIGHRCLARENRFAFFVLTIDRNWRWREIAIHRIEHHSTNPINAYRWRTPGLIIGSKGICGAGDGYPISSTLGVLGSYGSIRPSYTKCHWVGHVYCNRMFKLKIGC